MFNNILNNFLNPGNLVQQMVFRVIPALCCITFHELAHGYTAYKLGDRTAKDMGRLTLNPIKHIDIFGLLMMLFAYFGWAKPVPVNMMNFKKPKLGMAITSLAGPASNVLMSIVVFVLFGFLITPLQGSVAGDIILDMIYITAMMGIALAVFNLLPIPPLDGSKILFSLLPDKFYYRILRYERYGMIVLFGGLYLFRETLNEFISGISKAFSIIWIAAYALVN